MKDCRSCFVPVRDDVETNPYTLFRYNCINFSDSTAIKDGGIVYMYKEFERDVLRMSAVLRAFGLEPNSKVILDLDHNYYELVLAYALLYLGSTMVPVNGRNWESRRIESIIEQVEPCLYISGSKSIPKGVRSVSLAELIVLDVNDYWKGDMKYMQRQVVTMMNSVNIMPQPVIELICLSMRHKKKYLPKQHYLSLMVE